MSCPALPPSAPACYAPTDRAAEGVPDAGDACASVSDLMADLFSTRVCPAVFRAALDQGKVPPPPPILRAWCDRRIREGDAPGLLRRREQVGLGRALIEALTSLRVRRAGA